MGKESKKTNIIRGEEFIKKYLTGRVIDIGAGNDLVCQHAENFDKEHGDANKITEYRKIEAYDSVHSSHCLEHMCNPKIALAEWWSLIKMDGYLVLVVPDENLYEQGFWPSLFNGDHKNTFRINEEKSWSPVSWNILDLIGELPNVEIISYELQDHGYNYDFQTKFTDLKLINNYRINKLIMILMNKIKFLPPYIIISIENMLFKYIHFPIDQTTRGALTQIQIVARKVKK
jgi:hypothetical protein